MNTTLHPPPWYQSFTSASCSGVAPASLAVLMGKGMLTGTWPKAGCGLPRLPRVGDIPVGGLACAKPGASLERLAPSPRLVLEPAQGMAGSLALLVPWDSWLPAVFWASTAAVDGVRGAAHPAVSWGPVWGRGGHGEAGGGGPDALLRDNTVACWADSARARASRRAAFFGVGGGGSREAALTGGPPCQVSTATAPGRNKKGRIHM